MKGGDPYLTSKNGEMIYLFAAIKNHIAIICMIYGLVASAMVIVSGLAGYWLNGIYGMKFQVNDCSTLLSSGIGTGLIGFFKWAIDSIKNSPAGQFPNIGGKNNDTGTTGTRNS